jgi:hypothetical protein
MIPLLSSKKELNFNLRKNGQIKAEATKKKPKKTIMLVYLRNSFVFTKRICLKQLFPIYKLAICHYTKCANFENKHPFCQLDTNHINTFQKRDGLAFH